MKITMKSRNKKIKHILFSLIFCLALSGIFAGQAPAVDFSFPSLKIGIDKGEDPGDLSVLLQIVFLLTILSLAPAILILMTSFTRLAIVFSFLRQAMGTQQTS